PRRGRGRAAHQACPARGATGRDPGGDSPSPRALPRGDRAARRVLPLARQRRRDPRRPERARSLRRDPAGARAGGRGRVIIRKSVQEIEKMAAAGALVAETIALVGEHVRPGITTAELDRIGEEHIRARGGVPTSKGYRGFPSAICISPNSMVVHGIPGPYRLEEGDLVSVDVGVTLD